MKVAVYKIDIETLEKYVPEYKDVEYPDDEMVNNLTPYVKNSIPDIKRGDALEIGFPYGTPGRKSNFLFWNGTRVVAQCTEYYDYDGGGPPLEFKTFTEFPMDYFSEVAWFGSSVYLDYDTFADQIANWGDETNELVIEYNNEKYTLDLPESEAFDSLQEYIEAVKQGEAKYIILVNSSNKIVDIDGTEIN